MTGRYKVTGQFYTLQFLSVLLLHRKTGKAKKARNIREKITVREPILIILFEIGCRTTFPRRRHARMDFPQLIYDFTCVTINADGLGLNRLGAYSLAAIEASVDGLRVFRGHCPERIFDDDGSVTTNAKLQIQDMLTFVRH